MHSAINNQNVSLTDGWYIHKDNQYHLTDSKINRIARKNNYINVKIVTLSPYQVSSRRPYTIQYYIKPITLLLKCMATTGCSNGFHKLH